MDFITVSQENIDKEHICCCISDIKGETCVSSKKAWMKNRFEDGLVFLKLNARGKVFIEYIPAAYAWCPIEADGYMYIDCLWVSGSFAGKGYAGRLLEQCIADAKAKGMCGLTILSSDKKRGFLSDPKFLVHKGFQIADQAEPYFLLYYLPFTDSAPVPKFKGCVKSGSIDEKGMVLYYANQCPHTDKYAPILQEIAQRHGTSVAIHKIETTEQAQNAPTPFTSYSFYYNGCFVTNEIFSEKKFEGFLDKHGL